MKVKTFEETKKVSNTKGFLGYKNNITDIRIINGVTWKSRKRVNKLIFINREMYEAMLGRTDLNYPFTKLELGL